MLISFNFAINNWRSGELGSELLELELLLELLLDDELLEDELLELVSLVNELPPLDEDALFIA